MTGFTSWRLSVNVLVRMSRGLGRSGCRWSRFGMAIAAQLGGRLRAPVFGKFGLAEHAGALTGLAASRISAPLVFGVPWDDEVFPRHGVARTLRHLYLPGPDPDRAARTGPRHAHRRRTLLVRFLLEHLDTPTSKTVAEGQSAQP